MRLERERGSLPRFPGSYSNYSPVNNTLELAGIGNVPISIANANNNWGPRVGLAYRLQHNTVIRTGFGGSCFPRRIGQTNYPIPQNNGFPTANAFTASTVTMTTGFPSFTVVPTPADGIIRNSSLTSNYGITPRDLASP